jgi:hypothetical protein
VASPNLPGGERFAYSRTRIKLPGLPGMFGVRAERMKAVLKGFGEDYRYSVQTIVLPPSTSADSG